MTDLRVHDEPIPAFTMRRSARSRCADPGVHDAPKSAVVVGNAKTFTYMSTSGSYLNSPDLIAIDRSGNVWIGSRSYSVLVRIQASMPAADCSAGCTNLSLRPDRLFDMMIDGSSTVWLALKSQAGSVGFPSPQDSAVSSVNPGLTLTSVFPNSPEKAGNTNSATVYQQAASTALAVDNAGNLVVAGNSVFNQDSSLNNSLDLTRISGTGDVTFSYSVPSQFQGPNVSRIAIDATGNIWTISSGAVLEYPAAGGPAVVFNGGGISSRSVAIAIDSSGNVWVTNNYSANDNGSVTKIAPGALSDCSSGCTKYVSGTYLSSPSAIAIDGSDNVWVTASFGTLSGPGAPKYDNSTGVVKLSPGAATDCGMGCTAYVSDAFSTPNVELSGIAIDTSGNVWVLSYFSSTVIELPLVAAATATPIAAQPR